MRKSGVRTESEEASRSRCVSSAPVFILNIRLWRFSDGVNERVVPGQTSTSPPLERLTTAVSALAVIAEPTSPSFAASVNGPAARTDATTGWGEGMMLVTVGD